MTQQLTFFRLDRQGPIWTYTLDRPPVNALSLEVLSEVELAMAAVRAERDVRAVILTAAGQRCFAAGADIGQMPELDAVGGRALDERFQSAFQTVADCPVPVIAAVNGLALGGGLELALACDIRLAAEHAAFGLPEAMLGLIPGGGGTQRLPRLIPPGMAKLMMFSGRRLGAAAAQQLGLVEAVVPADRLLAEALALAGEIAARGPAAVRAIKAAVNGGLEQSLTAGLALELDQAGVLFGTSEAREGIGAFLAKRTPAFGPAGT